VKSDKKSGWKILKGKCRIDIRDRKKPCVVSPGYPGKYTTEDNCQFNLKNAAAITLDKYATEQYFDELKVDDTSYSGVLTGKKIPLKTSRVTWSADFFAEGKGWKVCRHDPMKNEKGRRMNRKGGK